MPPDSTPIVQDIKFYCDRCKRVVNGRMTAYVDTIYITCYPGKHHHAYDRSKIIPQLQSPDKAPRGYNEDEEGDRP